MWLTKQVSSNESEVVKSGEVLGGEYAVQGESKFASPETIFPYGFISVAAKGEKAVMLGDYCAGVAAVPGVSLNEGEVRLFSSGGAEILLKNSGEVIINGQVFNAE